MVRVVMSTKNPILPMTLSAMSVSLALATCSSSSPQHTSKVSNEGAVAPAASSAPLADKKAVTDEYHGEKVVDEYRWLEDWNDPTVQAWSKNLDS